VWGTVIAILVATEGALLLADGTWPGDVALIQVMLPVYAVMTPLSLHYRNRLALRALAQTRVLLSDEATYDDLRYRITQLPAGRTAVAALSGLAVLGLLLLGRPEGADEALGLYTSPAVTWLQWVFQVLTWSGVGITGYHILRQALLVHEVYTRHARIDLFSPGPLYALSRLTAANTVFTIVVGAVGAAAVAPADDPGSSPTTPVQWVIFLIVMLVVIGASFVAPLYGAHRLLVTEKTAALDAVGTRAAALIDMVESRVDHRELADAAEVNALLEALAGSREVIGRIRTWPWEPDTSRVVTTALVAPVVIYLVTQALDAWL
jgi:hypothetical protein